MKNGDLLVKGLIVQALTDIAMFVNVGENNNFNTLQITQTTELILEDFKFLKLEDFKLFFNKMKKGHYGKLFNRLDGQVVLEQLHVYCHERSLEAEQINFKAHSEHKSGKVNLSEVNKEGQKKVIEILSEALKSVEVLKVEKKPREKNANEKLIQRFITQFQKIAIKRGLNNDTKYIFMYAKTITCEEYLYIKVKQCERVMKLINPKQP